MSEHEEAVAAMVLQRFAVWLLDDLDISLTRECGIPPEQHREWLERRAAVWLAKRRWLANELLRDLATWG